MVVKSADAAKNSWNFKKKLIIFILDQFLKSHQISENLDESLKGLFPRTD